MLGLAILLAFNMLGYIGQHVLHIPLPANVLGLMLLLIALFMKWVKLEWIEASAQFMLQHMLIFFAPTIVGTMVFFSRIREEWLAIVVSLVGSALVVLFVAGGVTKLLDKRTAASAESSPPGGSGKGTAAEEVSAP